MKITFIISTLYGGGAERVAVTLANELTKRGHFLQFIVHSDIKSDYELDQGIKVHSLYTEKETGNSLFYKLWRKGVYYFRLNEILNQLQSDVIVSFIRGTNGKVLPFSYLKGIPHIATEHDTFKIDRNEIWPQFERRYLYKLASVVTVLIERDWRDYYSKYLKNVEVLPNPLPFEICSSNLKERSKFILSAGNLNRWQFKGFDKLIIVFSKIHKEFPDWRLKIAGKGEQGEKQLKEIAIRNKVDHKVDFLGFVNNMPELYREASIFALYSKNEPFGMVLTEAMSQGCPCICFDSGFGPSEIINDGEDGLLVQEDDIDVFAGKLKQMMNQIHLRKKLSENALQNIQRYSIKNITNKWEKMLHKVVGENKI